MSRTGDPARLREQLPSSSLLGRGLRAANLEGPTDEQLHDLERDLAAGLLAAALAAPAVKAASTASGASWLSVTASKVILVTLSFATVGGGALAISHVLAERATKKATLQAQSSTADPRQPRAIATVVPLPDPPARSQASAGEKSIPARPRVAPPGPRRARFSLGSAPQPNDETTLLDRAQRALARDPELALSLTNRHREYYADGSLTEEREFIGILALIRLGYRQDARERTAQFLHAFPRSAYRARVEQLQDGEERE